MIARASSPKLCRSWHTCVVVFSKSWEMGKNQIEVVYFQWFGLSHGVVGQGWDKWDRLFGESGVSDENNGFT